MTFKQSLINWTGIVFVLSIWITSFCFTFGLVYIFPFLMEISKTLSEEWVILLIVLGCITCAPLVFVIIFLPLRIADERGYSRYMQLLQFWQEMDWIISKKQIKKRRHSTSYRIWYAFISHNGEECEWYEDLVPKNVFNSLNEGDSIKILVSRENPHDFCSKTFSPYIK